jgi:hypothetical protein
MNRQDADHRILFYAAAAMCSLFLAACAAIV